MKIDKTSFEILKECLTKAPNDNSDIIVPLDISVADPMFASIISYIQDHCGFKTSIMSGYTTTIIIRRSENDTKPRRDHSLRTD